MMLPMRTRGATFNTLLDMSRDMDRLVSTLWPEGTQPDGGGWMPAEVIETGEEVRFDLELPGVSEDMIDVTLENNVLTVTAEKQLQREEGRKEGDYRLFERRYGRFQRSFTVPPTVKADACTASYENGVLRLRLPKAEEAKPRRIRIGGNGEAGRDVG